jgi:hypothetical protein
MGLAPHLLRALFAEGQFTFKVLYIYIFDPLASVGYGDIFPRNIIERVVCHGMGQGMIFTMIGPWEKIFGGSLNGG